MQDVEEMKQIASEVRMETVLDLLGLDRPNSGHKIPSIKLYGKHSNLQFVFMNYYIIHRLIKKEGYF